MFYFIGVLLLAVASLLFHMLVEAFSNNVNEQEFTFTDFPESVGNISIFFISDIHRRIISDHVISRVKGKANVVLIGGDLVEKGVPYTRVTSNLTKLKQLGPVYFVRGNNDYEVAQDEFQKILDQLEVTVLDNTAAAIESERREKLCILGVDTFNLSRDRLDLALAEADEDSFKILVSHYPDIIQKILPEHNIRLVLSGHTHGGQIHILGYSPYKRGGISKFANTILLISNGYGTTALPLRLGAPAECHLITLKRKQIG